MLYAGRSLKRDKKKRTGMYHFSSLNESYTYMVSHKYKSQLLIHDKILSTFFCCITLKFNILYTKNINSKEKKKKQRFLRSPSSIKSGEKLPELKRQLEVLRWAEQISGAAREWAWWWRLVILKPNHENPFHFHAWQLPSLSAKFAGGPHGWSPRWHICKT